MSSLYLIDASVYIFRAYFALPASLTDAHGQPFNAAYGFAGFLCDFLGDVRPGHVALAFDESLTTCFRNDFFPDYKANREPAPPDLLAQLAACRRLAEALAIPAFADARFEADDLIGSLAAMARSQDVSSVIVSRDKDLAQVLHDGDTFWDYAAGTRLDPEGVRARFGVRPAQIADFLALVGDPVDNIPGIPGIGPKAAAALLAHYPDLDAIYADPAPVERLPVRGARRLRGLLEDGEAQARLSQRLARIRTDASPVDTLAELTWRPPEAAAIESWCTRHGVGDRLSTRLMKFADRENAEGWC